MLDVERRIDVDTARQQLLDVHVALRMAAAGDVGVGQLIDQDELRPPFEDRVQVHFRHGLAAIVHSASRHRLQPHGQTHGLRSAVGLDDADHHVDALAPPGLRGGEHLVCLAHAGCRTEEDLQTAAGGFLRLPQQGIR